jgi:hypothetical protein
MAKISPADITLPALKAGQFQAEFPQFYNLKKVIENSAYHNQQIGLLLFVYADLLGSDLQAADPKMYQARIAAVEEMLAWATL